MDRFVVKILGSIIVLEKACLNCIVWIVGYIENNFNFGKGYMLQEIPRIGLGTWKLTGETCKEAVKTALDIGYRHIDTAVVYGNEQEIGDALKESGFPREKLWITTKIWIDSFGYQACLDSVEASLSRLQIDYLDLVLLHWPCRETHYNHHEAFDALMQLKRQGKIRFFGVSNFNKTMLQEAIEYTQGQIFAQQIEYHVNLGQEILQAFGQFQGLILEAYSPLAHGHLGADPVLVEIAAKHGKTVSQIALRWLLDQPNVVVLPKASSRDHLEENFAVEGWTLDEEDHSRIAQLPKHFRYCDIEGLRPEWD